MGVARKRTRAQALQLPPIISVVTRCGLTKMQRRLPQFWLNTTNSTDTVATDDSDDRIRVRNHHDQPHEELKSNVTSTRANTYHI